MGFWRGGGWRAACLGLALLVASASGADAAAVTDTKYSKRLAAMPPVSVEARVDYLVRRLQGFELLDGYPDDRRSLCQAKLDRLKARDFEVVRPILSFRDQDDPAFKPYRDRCPTVDVFSFYTVKHGAIDSNQLVASRRLDQRYTANFELYQLPPPAPDRASLGPASTPEQKAGDAAAPGPGEEYLLYGERSCHGRGDDGSRGAAKAGFIAYSPATCDKARRYEPGPIWSPGTEQYEYSVDRYEYGGFEKPYVPVPTDSAMALIKMDGEYLFIALVGATQTYLGKSQPFEQSNLSPARPVRDPRTDFTGCQFISSERVKTFQTPKGVDRWAD